MKNDCKRYYPIKGGEGERNGNKIKRLVKCYLSYELGGINWANGQHERRGYYAHVSPVTLEDHGDGIVIESYVAFSGGKWLLVECSRKSPKKEAEAIRLFEEKHKDMVLQIYKDSPDKDKIDFGTSEK